MECQLPPARCSRRPGQQPPLPAAPFVPVSSRPACARPRRLRAPARRGAGANPAPPTVPGGPYPRLVVGALALARGALCRPHQPLPTPIARPVDWQRQGPLIGNGKGDSTGHYEAYLRQIRCYSLGRSTPGAGRSGDGAQRRPRPGRRGLSARRAPRVRSRGSLRRPLHEQRRRARRPVDCRAVCAARDGMQQQLSARRRRGRGRERRGSGSRGEEGDARRASGTPRGRRTAMPAERRPCCLPPAPVPSFPRARRTSGVRMPHARTCRPQAFMSLTASAVSALARGQTPSRGAARAAARVGASHSCISHAWRTRGSSWPRRGRGPVFGRRGAFVSGIEKREARWQRLRATGLVKA
jgi:hypothetical protein